MPKLEKDDEAKRELLKKIERICNQLSLWELFQIYLYIKRVELSEKWDNLVWSWLTFQLKLGNQIRTIIK
jgi:hypothetical protein